jgi:hypothetical protein
VIGFLLRPGIELLLRLVPGAHSRGPFALSTILIIAARSVEGCHGAFAEFSLGPVDFSAFSISAHVGARQR